MFTYNNWEQFCKKLNESGINSVTASSLLVESYDQPFLVLKHDVETSPEKALNMAKIENKYNHKGTYYVQGYLLNSQRNISILREIQKLGHEVSYHHDVMDSNKGNVNKALVEFKNYVKMFESQGFLIKTVCQHGNPLVERLGYNSNRDFFRQKCIQEQFSNVFEIMVNFKEKILSDYLYFSDAGRKYKLIYDPINNDINDYSDKDIEVNGLSGMFSYFKNNNCILSVHPHRWSRNYFLYFIRSALFKSLRFLARVAYKIPGLKKIMSKYYYLAKKL